MRIRIILLSLTVLRTSLTRRHITRTRRTDTFRLQASTLKISLQPTVRHGIDLIRSRHTVILSLSFGRHHRVNSRTMVRHRPLTSTLKRLPAPANDLNHDFRGNTRTHNVS